MAPQSGDAPQADPVDDVTVASDPVRTGRLAAPNREVIICETRAVTGSRFTRRVCRTQYQTDATAEESRRYVEGLRSGVAPPEAAILSPGPSSSGPQ